MGIIPGVTWGTAVEISGAQLIHGLWSLNHNEEVFRPTGVGFGNFVKEVVRLGVSVGVTLTVDVRYGCAVMQALTHILGQDTSTETTVSEGDYAHVMKFDEENDGEFSTFAASYGTSTNDILELPSVKWHTFEWSQAANGVGTITVEGIANRVVTSGATNNLADLTGSTYQDDVNFAVFGDANHYFRMNSQGGDALDSGDDKNIMDFTLRVSRPMSSQYTLRGANTRYVNEPKQLGLTEGTLRTKFHRILASDIDLLSIWTNKTQQKAEIFMDGSQIGGGVNRSYKIQMPGLYPLQFPQGFDYPNNNSRMEPEMTFDLLYKDSAPTGMTGVNYLAITAVNERVAAYT